MQTLNGRALDGTPCGKNKWCMDRKCVHNPQAKSQKGSCCLLAFLRSFKLFEIYF